MNYIRHLSGFFIRLAEDQRMTPYHISLYFALFQQWNAERFGDWFVISRSEMMQLSRIGSANTYARCIKELSDWGYISYTASSNIHSGSRVSCIRFDTAPDIARNTEIDTGIKTNTSTDTGNDTGRNTGISGSTENDTGRDTACDTSTKSDTASDTTNDTGRNTGTSSNPKSDTRSDTASDTGITANTETDTGRSTVSEKKDAASIKTDTGCDTGSDTLLINSLNKNKQEEKSVRGNQKLDVDENGKKQKRLRTTNSKNLPDEKSPVPDLSEVEQFFEQNQFPRSEAQKFYAHYQSSGWKTGDMKKIISWQAVARKWMNNTQSFKTDEREFNQVGTSKHSVTVNKNYAEPL
ncbi:hypothetical protein AQPE_4608 [Aquipluma nitroreducens]|uniref:Uncharacterized protein n=1 Tax=Aquipluma nitroreducens TaxID=2010828 RepID=A0A5K7SG10_9BACT|nr:hypothetical protein [Aquipluma nitroreducens]BBE20416.1 hypothetical protein AQPE_4608 [Aquipluma nitroreducens]